MRTQGGVDLEREIRVRGLTHAEAERILGYKGNGIISHLISGMRSLPIDRAIVCEREFGIPIAHWGIPFDAEKVA
jgi:plasmid maintenance system antidote protein VapI